MKTKRLTTTEQRQKTFADNLTANGGGTINIEWRKSRDYGYCPAVLNYRGEKIAYASGCGYNKLSAVLVEALSFLLPDRALAGCSGAGERSVTDRLADHGWKLERTANGNTFDSFHLSRA